MRDILSRLALASCLALTACEVSVGSGGGGIEIPAAGEREHPILFVTQVPIKGDWANSASAFNNQKPDTHLAYRGGDLYILYGDGELKNLTKLAGYGVEGLQVGPTRSRCAARACTGARPRRSSA